MRTRMLRSIALLTALLLPGVAAAQAPAPKGFQLRSADGANSLRVLGLLQLQLAHGRLDGSPVTSAFRVHRARVGLLGSVLSRDLRYTFVAEFAGERPRLLFLDVDYTFVPGWLALRVGQFKRPFSRPFMTLASELATIDRPSTVGPKVFGDDADIGVMLHNGIASRFEYAVGVFNGAGPNALPDRVHPLVAVRVAYAAAGLQPYSESDLEGGPARVGVAAAGLFDLDADGDGRSFASGLVDVMIKARGWSLSSALYVGSRQAGPRWSDRRLDAFGHYTQLGRVIARRFEPVVRYSALLPDPSHDVTGGLNVFFRGHPFKWQTFATVRFQPRDGASGHDMRVQTQLSLSF